VNIIVFAGYIMVIGDQMERLVFTIPEACEVARASRTSLYGAIGRGELTARKRGRRTLILLQDLEAWIGGLPKLSAGAPVSHSAPSTTSSSSN
jgi:excisionase family DNA binding protein